MTLLSRCSTLLAAAEPASVRTVRLDLLGQFDPEVLGFQPNAPWLFMADASQWRLLSSGHTWLLWDEVTTLTLSHTPLTPSIPCIVLLSATIGLFTNRG